MGSEAIKAALEKAKSAVDEALAACEGESYSEESEESSDTPAQEVSEDKGMRQKAIAAKIKKNLYG